MGGVRNYVLYSWLKSFNNQLCMNTYICEMIICEFSFNAAGPMSWSHFLLPSFTTKLDIIWIQFWSVLRWLFKLISSAYGLPFRTLNALMQPGGLTIFCYLFQMVQPSIFGCLQIRLCNFQHHFTELYKRFRYSILRHSFLQFVPPRM